MLARWRLFLAGGLLCLLQAGVLAAAPEAAITASPISGSAPLAVSFDASASSADVTSYFWTFGDGSASTAKSVTHIYTVAGDYVAVLLVTNAAGESATSSLAITVTGSGSGPLSNNVNFRWALTSAKFKLNFLRPGKDRLVLTSAFNTVDLPDRLKGLAASFSINDDFTINGVLGDEGIFESREKTKPRYFVQLSIREQRFRVDVSAAALQTALARSGAVDANVRQGRNVPVKFSLTVGAQTYSLTEQFTYKATAGCAGQGQFSLERLDRGGGAVQDGFFVVGRASALENFEGTGHFFEFDCYLSPPLLKQLTLPGKLGTWTFHFNQATPEVLLDDRILLRGGRLIYSQPERDRGGIRSLKIDPVRRRMQIRTWDLRARALEGGTGQPLRKDPFNGFNFSLRLDLDQTDGTVFQGVTGTRLTRRSRDDAFWQTGRR